MKKKILGIGLFVLFLAGFFYNANALTVEEYCQLKMEWLSYERQVWQNKIDLLNQYHSDPDMFLAKEAQLCNEEKSACEEFLKTYGTNSEEFHLVFPNEHGVEIDTYLENNPEIRDQIDSLSAQNDSLISQYEDLLATYGIRGGE